MYKAVIFDVDGTLFDTSEGIFRCINYVLIEENLPNLEIDTLRKFIGPPVYESFMNYCNVDDELALRLTKKYRTYYVDKYVKYSKLYENMLGLLEDLKRASIKIGIATMKTQIQIDTLLANEGLADYFDMVIGVECDGDKKENMIKKNAEIFGIKNMKNIAMVGDTYSDAKAANIAGANFVGVTYGFGLKTQEDLNGLSYIALCENVCELKNILTK